MEQASAVKKLVAHFWPEKGHLNEDQRDFLIDLLQEKNPRFCIETGFCTGRSSITTLIACTPVKLVSIDVKEEIEASDLSSFKSFKFIKGDSRHILKNKFFKKEFPEGIDYAFIDGDHSYEGCLNDLVSIYPHMNPKGIMVIDDYMSGPPNGGALPEVDKAIHDFIKSKNIVIQKWNKKGKGFAIIRKD